MSALASKGTVGGAGGWLALGTAMSFTPGSNTTLSTALAANLGLRRALRFCMAVPVGWARLLWFNRGMAAVLVLTTVWMGQA